MREDSGRSFFVLGGIAIGVAGLGMVLLFLLARRLLMQVSQVPQFWPEPVPAPLPLPPIGDHEEAPLMPPTYFESLRLSATEPAYVMEAGRRPVEVRVVGPAGTYAMFATDPSVLLQATTVGRVFVIPAGERQTLPLNQGERLYGLGSVASVIISVSG